MPNAGRLLKLDWRGAILEVALIIVAILAALAVDAWWQSVQDERAATAYLQALRADFVENRARLDIHIDRSENAFEVGQELHAAIADGIDADQAAIISGRLVDFYVIDLWATVSGTYDEMVASGRLQLIGSAELRVALARYRKALDTVSAAERLLLDNWHDAQAPFLRERLVMTDLREVEDYRPEAPFSNDLDALGTREYWNLVSEWMFMKRDLVSVYRSFRDRGDEIIAMIDAELGEYTSEN